MLLDEMEIFYYVVEFKSFSKAAARLQVSKSFISKKIAKLEQDLKVKLLSRSTRKLMITEAGEDFYHYCASVVQQARAAYSAISELQKEPSGKLKISVPPALGLNLLPPLFVEFLSQYPAVSLDVRLENKVVDLLQEGYDLVLRSALMNSSNLIAQKIFSIKNIICATPHYLMAHDALIVPHDLEKHNVAVYYGEKHNNKIILLKDKQKEVVSIKGNFISNQLELIKQMTLSGECMALLPQFMVKQELTDGRITACLTDYQLPDNPLYAVYPERNFMLPKVKFFLDLLKLSLASH